MTAVVRRVPQPRAAPRADVGDNRSKRMTSTMPLEPGHSLSIPAPVRQETGFGHAKAANPTGHGRDCGVEIAVGIETGTLPRAVVRARSPMALVNRRLVKPRKRARRGPRRSCVGHPMPAAIRSFPPAGGAGRAQLVSRALVGTWSDYRRSACVRLESARRAASTSWASRRH